MGWWNSRGMGAGELTSLGYSFPLRKGSRCGGRASAPHEFSQLGCGACSGARAGAGLLRAWRLVPCCL